MAASCYGFDRCYRWLRGKLEYSTADGRWRLRYIPMGCAADAYGGSVVLANSPQLQGLLPDTYAEVRGQVNCSTARPGGAPEYLVAEIRRL
jgi:hypothetical protein